MMFVFYCHKCYLISKNDKSNPELDMLKTKQIWSLKEYLCYYIMVWQCCTGNNCIYSYIKCGKHSLVLKKKGHTSDTSQLSGGRRGGEPTLRVTSFRGSWISSAHSATMRAKLVCGSSSLFIKIHCMLLIQSSMPIICSMPFFPVHRVKPQKQRECVYFTS